MPPKLNDTFKHEFVFTEEQVLTYAKISGDTNPIHVSNEYAGQTEFGKCIVHGYFATSIFSKIYGTLLYPDGHILLSQSAKYIKPIFTDIPYIAVITVKELIPEKSRVVYLNEIFDVENQQLKITGEATLLNKNYFN
ncbi:MaoC family dehydratase [Mucilaginibacter dorajii]|uniref:MaoC-like domain-containing protein n=1 Tax=Mucilaginibacter dorajii TaxID=692994 RepID=A0ABP7QC40_9SPHI|nr:MaoC family dehydratase [Mucilaginibacter dorajii]MCS3733106.1 acyl dehydratase [Mucilaginibacter dorajii]